MNATRRISDLDFVMIGLTIALLAVGVLTIYSATHESQGAGLRTLHAKQLLLIGVALGATCFVIFLMDYHTVGTLSGVLYGAVLIALGAVLAYGHTAGGSQRWIPLGFFNLQPSEPAKIVIVLVLAKYYERFARIPLRLRDLVLPSVLVGMPALLVLKQPDLGTAAMFFLIFAVMTLVVGVELRTLIVLGMAAVASIPLFWFKILHPYQKARLLTLLNPGVDPLGAGYHSIQAKIAVGSGGWLGKGLLSGTQSRLNFLPEKHTDFIFAVLAEETGYLGCTLFLLLYFALLARAIEVAATTTDRFGCLVVTGVTGMLALHLFFNAGMTMGIAPVVGLPLPFVSYGGSCLLTSLVGIGLILNVRMRRTSPPGTGLWVY